LSDQSERSVRIGFAHLKTSTLDSLRHMSPRIATPSCRYLLPRVLEQSCYNAHLFRQASNVQSILEALTRLPNYGLRKFTILLQASADYKVIHLTIPGAESRRHLGFLSFQRHHRHFETDKMSLLSLPVRRFSQPFDRSHIVLTTCELIPSRWHS